MPNRKLQALAALVVFSSLTVQADDYAYPDGFVAVSAIDHEAATLSCEEARETAWFIRELQRTDGDTNPEVEPVMCGRELIAASTAADYD